jgi:hypothetical protein
MRTIQLALLGLIPVSFACTSDIPSRPPGDRISGTLRYDGNAHLALSRPALQVFASIAIPPSGTPHGIVVLENPDFTEGVVYELAMLPEYDYKVAAQIIDLNNEDTDQAQLPFGGYPDMCTLLLAPTAGLVQVKEQIAAIGIDIQLFDGSGMMDPCFVTLGEIPP